MFNICKGFFCIDFGLRYDVREGRVWPGRMRMVGMHVFVCFNNETFTHINFLHTHWLRTTPSTDTIFADALPPAAAIIRPLGPLHEVIR